jgi:hypothetical protein
MGTKRCNSHGASLFDRTSDRAEHNRCNEIIGELAVYLRRREKRMISVRGKRQKFSLTIKNANFTETATLMLFLHAEERNTDNHTNSAEKPNSSHRSDRLAKFASRS